VAEQPAAAPAEEPQGRTAAETAQRMGAFARGTRSGRADRTTPEDGPGRTPDAGRIPDAGRTPEPARTPDAGRASDAGQTTASHDHEGNTEG
ncbi:hypothetical protein ACWD10_22180, partial [Streptomyces sp. NPDC002851]